MFDLAPHQLMSIAATIACLIGLGYLAYRLDKRAEQRQKGTKDDANRPLAPKVQHRRSNPAPIPGESRREHIERLARLRAASRSTQMPPKPAPTRTPGPGMRPHPVYGTETHRPRVIPPADLLAPITTRGEGDCFNPTIPGADWKPAGGEFGGGGASGTWDAPSADTSSTYTATTASTAE